MILPSKHLPSERALLFVGARVLRRLDRPKTVSQVWSEISRRGVVRQPILNFDWFVLALDFLFMTEAITFDRGLMSRQKK